MLSASGSAAPGTDWPRFLASLALAPASPAAAATEAPPASHACVLSDLSGYALIEVSGPDAESFLHAQLSSDVRALGPDRCQLATYNSPKGRVLATLLLWRSGEGFLLQVPAALATSLAKRLSLFVLRSKVRLAAAGERLIRFGLAGAQAGELLDQAGLAVPTADFGLVSGALSTNAMQPDAVLRLDQGRIAEVGTLELAQRIARTGFAGA